MRCLMRWKNRVAPLLVGLMLLVGCSSAGKAQDEGSAAQSTAEETTAQSTTAEDDASAAQTQDGDNMTPTYTQINQETAKEMMKQDDGHIIVDVRRQDEYDAGHIPGAILIPNESIETERPEELPDLDQVILIYCRSGNRSKQASQKLADMGYTNIYEFGGIITWTGEVVTE